MQMYIPLFLALTVFGLFEWIHPETWRKETKEAAAMIEEPDLETVSEKVKEGRDAVNEGYQKAKDSIVDTAKSAKYHYWLMGCRNSANDYLFEPLKRLFQPQQSGHEEPEWLYHALMASSPPRHFFRTFPDEYILFADCPGIPPSAIKVSLQGNRMVKIQGTHEACIEEKGSLGREGRLCVERHVDRQYRYPEDVNPDTVESAIRDGVLAIRFPRIQPVGREIPVKQVKSGF